MAITKKEFKENCRHEVYTGWNGHRTRKNAFFYDWKSGETSEGKYFTGYKYMMAANVKEMSKAELFKLFYQWVNNQIDNYEIPWNKIKFSLATNDEQRFKVSLSM